MLPSTGYFKGYSCPFYDGVLCERPYCHFRHVKRDTQSTSDGVESGMILQKLVSAEVKKILQQTDVSGSVTSIEAPGVSAEISNATSVVPSNTKVIYNPTPIAELNKINNTDPDSNEDVEQRKRHIPVPYTPRKPVGMPLRRPVETNGSTKPFIYIPPPVKYTPGSAENVQCDAYSPSGTVESTEKYIPGSEKELQEYKPNETSENATGRRNYIPSDKNDSKKKILEYKPIKVSTTNKLPSVTYQPTPRSLAPCFSSDEEEPEIKKRKLSNDLNGLDDLGPEFDILDQILDEEKQEHDSKSNGKSKTEISKPSKIKEDDVKETQAEFKLKNKSQCKTQSDKDSNKNTKAEKKESSKDKKLNKTDKSTSKDKDQKDKSKYSDMKSSHKSSYKDRDKDKNKHKNRNDKEKHSDKSKSKSSDKHSKSSDKHSKSSNKHSSNSKRSSSKESRSLKSSNKTDHRKSHRISKESKEKHSNNKKNAADLSDTDNAVSTCEIEEEPYISESDEEAIALECKKIFEEYVPIEKPKVVEDTSQIEDSHEDEYLPAKKRIARAGDSKVMRNPPVKREQKLSAAQVMAERLAKVKEFHTTKNVSLTPKNDMTQKLDSVKCPFNVPSSGITKLRIAHVPYASTLVNAKKLIPPNQNVSKCEPSTSSMPTNSTVVQTIKKGAQRVAHIPNEKFIDRPGVLEPLGSKIPPNIRSTYLNMMIDECLKLYISATDAYARAQHEELATSKKCSTVQIYKNSAVLTVSRLRKELLECNGVKKTGFDCSTLQRTLTGKTIESGSWSIENKNRKTIDNQEFTGSKLFKNIQKWILTEEQLQQNGYPRPHQSGEKGRAIIYGQNKQKPPKGLIRTCCRCKKDYSVDKKGFPAFKEECIYHPNNKYRMRGEVRYQCCSQDGTSDGCCIAPNHVYEYVDYENLRGYVKTLPPDSHKDDYGVYSLDCEMCYTTHGLDLTRLTVINSACKVVYETLIKPLHPIIDYNTRFSGITEEQMAEVKTSLLEVQATLLTMFSSKTILIGHSLESDFKALKLIHDTVIDTSVLFPHKMGPPYKRALRNLSSEYLKKIIQNSVEGHNSAEDATVCMELIHYKLKEDLKTR